MRIPEKQHQAAYRIARPTPSYNDEVSKEFIERQQAHINAQHPEGVQLTLISGDAW
jgi:hypothetical protein